MHELAITKEIVRIVEQECKERDARPKKVFVELGSLSSYKEMPLMYYYDILKTDSKIISNSSLLVKETEGNDLIIKEILTR